MVVVLWRQENHWVSSTCFHVSLWGWDTCVNVCQPSWSEFPQLFISFFHFWPIFSPFFEGGSGQALSQAALDKVNVKLTAKITTHPPPNANQSWPPTNPLHCHQPPVTATHYQSTPPTMTHWIWEVRNFQGEKVQKNFLVPNELKSPKNNTSFYFFFPLRGGGLVGQTLRWNFH